MSVALSTSVASDPKRLPIWPPNIRPPICCMTPISGAAAARISSGIALPKPSTTLAAMGSTSSDPRRLGRLEPAPAAPRLGAR